MKNNGFTLIELLAVIVIIGIVMLITIPIVSDLISEAGQKTFNANSESMVKAAENYYVDHILRLPASVGKKTYVFLDYLMSKGYIKPLKNPNNEDEVCVGYVQVTKTGSDAYSYDPFLKCGNDYITNEYIDLSDRLIVDLPLGKIKLSDGKYKDLSGNGNHGVNYGSTMGLNRFKEIDLASSFDGISNKVEIAIDTSKTPTNTFSITFWAKTSEVHQIDPEVVAGTHGTSGQKYAFGARHRINDGGAGVSIGTNGISVYEHGSGYMPAIAVYSGTVGENWNFISIIYNNKKPSIYLNGKLVKVGLTSPKALVYAPNEIGNGSYGGFNGMIDDIRIYDKVLSENEIELIYNYR